jgi:hypothetical protein
MFLQQNYGFWERWENPHKVTFDGVNKLIIVNHGETLLGVKIDVYSAWKEWMLSHEDNNTRFEPAMRSVGGDPTTNGQFIGGTYFLTNGWRMRTWEGDHRLTVAGNLYTDEGEPPFIPTLFDHTISIEYQVSSIVTIAGTYTSPDDLATAVWASEDVPTIPTVQEVAYAVWEEAMFGHSTPDSFGKRLKEILPTLWGVK